MGGRKRVRKGVSYQVSFSALYQEMKAKSRGDLHYTPGRSGQIEFGLMLLGMDVRDNKLKRKDTHTTILELGQKYMKVPAHLSISDPDVEIIVIEDKHNQRVNVTVMYYDAP